MMLRMVRSLSILLTSLLFIIGRSHGQRFATGDLLLEMNQHGQVVSLRSIITKVEYVPSDNPGYLLQLVEKDRYLIPMKASFGKDRINLEFPEGRRVIVKVLKNRYYLRFEVERIDGHADAAVWGPFNTSIGDTIGNMVGIVRNIDFAIGLRTLNKKTSGGVLQNQEGAVFDNGSTARSVQFGSSLQAFTVNRSKDRTISIWERWKDVPVKAIPDGQIEGSAIAVFGCRPAYALNTIDIINKKESIPYAQWNGKWIKRSVEPGRPYMITNFNEDNIDVFLDYAKRMGLAGVYHPEPFETWGHFVLNKAMFPNGVNGFKACVDKAHALGLRLGFHTLTNFITTNDSYVSPVPHPNLMTAGSTPLSVDIDSIATEIPIDASQYFEMESDLNSVRIDEEIIRFRQVSKEKPIHLIECQRGAFGTKNATHSLGAKVSRLLDHPYKVFFPDWDLQKELAGNLTRFINNTGADQMDFDGHEGTYATGMGDLSFDTFAEDVFKNSNHPVVFGSSRANHYFWNVNHYLNWGEPWYGGFRESQSDVRIANQEFYEKNYLPNMLGWFLVNDQTSIADIDWMLARAAGYNAGYALVIRENARENPNLEKIVEQIRLWTSAQHGNVFSAEQRQLLKQTNSDVHLYNEKGAWFLQIFRKHEFTHEQKMLQPGQPSSSTWSFSNDGLKQYGQYVLRMTGTKGDVRNPEIEIDNTFQSRIPVALSPGESLVIDEFAKAKLYDAKGKFIKHVDLERPFPVLSAGEHHLAIDAEMQDGIQLQVTIRLLSKTEQL